MHATEIDEPLFDIQTDSTVDKAVFIIFAHGPIILSKIRKVAESLSATIFSLPLDPRTRKEQLHECNARLDDVVSVFQNTNTTLQAELRVIAENMQHWKSVIRREKSIYYALNMFNYAADRKTLISEAWLARNDLAKVQSILENVGISGAVPTMHELHTGKEPPTFHRTNKLTEEFQTIIDSYGVAKYREVYVPRPHIMTDFRNPAVASIVTFPFMFAVMFGDIGTLVTEIK
jgi:V-type H+-transporting ATPase subunit a